MLKINRPNYKFKRCDRVVRVNNPVKHGTVLFRYSRPIKRYSDLMLGPYPELYIVKWDTGKIEKDIFWYGLLQKERFYECLINQEFTCPHKSIGTICFKCIIPARVYLNKKIYAKRRSAND